MKAIVKATGDIVEVLEDKGMYYCADMVKWFYACELDFIDEDYSADYWDKLLHQYAGMAMQGLLSNQKYIEKIIEKKEYECFSEDLAVVAIHLSTALVEKLKNA